MSTHRRHRRSSSRANTEASPSRSGLKRPVLYVAAILGLLGAVATGAFLLTRSSPEDDLSLAASLMEKGDYRGAEIALKNTLEAEPGNAEARYSLGYAMYKSGQYPSAEKELNIATQQGIRHPDLPVLLAATLLRMGKADKLLEAPPPAADAPAEARADILALRARALQLKGRRQEAELALAEAEQTKPGHPQVMATRAEMLFASGQPDQALTLMDQALAADAKLTSTWYSKAELWISKGDMLGMLKRGPEAKAAYVKAVALDPKSINPRLSIISILLQEGRVEEAANEIKQASQIAPGNFLLHYLEAQLEFRQGKYQAAQDRLLQVLKVAPDYPPAQRLAGMAFLQNGQRESAINHLTRYLGSSPKDDHARKLLATALLETGQTERASALLGEMGENLPDDPVLSTLRGDIALRGGNLAEAQKHLSKAVNLSPKNPQLLLQLASRLMSSGDPRGAQTALEKAAALEPANEQAVLMLTAMEVKAGRHDQALKVIDAMARARPQSPIAPYLRGTVEQARNRQDQARQQFQAALKLDPTYFPAVVSLARLESRNNNLKGARQQYDTLLKLKPGHAKALLALAELDLLERNDKAFLDHLDQAKAADPKDPIPRVLVTRYWLDHRETTKALDEARAGLDATGSPVFYELLGGIHLSHGDKQEAISTYTKWRDSEPQNSQAHYRLALAQHSGGDLNGAAKSLDKALVINPNDGDVVLAKTRLLVETHREADALALAQAFQKRQPNAPQGMEAEARVRAAQGQHADAAAQWARAGQLSNRSAHAIQAYAAYKQAGQIAKGEAYLATWLSQHPKDIPVRHSLAQSQIERGLNKEAAGQYEQILKLAPKDVVALNNLATAYGRLGDKRALETARMAADLAPGNALVLDTYGWLLSETGQAKAGVPYLKKALAGLNDNAEIRWHLAVALHKSGDAPGAVAELDRLLTSRIAFPQQDDARKLLAQLRGGGR